MSLVPAGLQRGPTRSTSVDRPTQGRGRGVSRWAALVASLACGLIPAGGARGDTFTALRAATEMELAVAARTLDDMRGSDDGAEIAKALVELNRQPRRRTQIDAAAVRLERLAASARSRELRVMARYYLARIEQLHRFEPNREAAVRAYESLWNDAPEHPFAQLGLARLALLQLYDPSALPAERADRFSRLATDGSRLAFAPAQRDFHYVMGVVALRLEMPIEKALEHLEKAEAAGLVQDKTRAAVQIRVAELARELGHTAVARAAYERFVRDNPRDPRSTLARARLAELESGP